MNLSTSYLGLKLRTPLVPSASPLSDRLDDIKRMEDAGASAVVLYSLFEEQLSQDRHALDFHLTQGADSFPEALSFFPTPLHLPVGPDAYLKHIADARQAVNIPIIASLNGATLSGWTEFAAMIQQAGAHALELNIYRIAADLNENPRDVEQACLDILAAVKEAVSIPVAVKVSPFFSSLANMAKRLVHAGANGLVLFNRFYQPDIDLETLEVTPNFLLSSPMAMRLPLRWIAILHGRVDADLAATSGIHRPTDAIKMLMAGADVTMLCSVLMKKGIAHLAEIEQGMRDWMESHEYDSVEQLKGSLSHEKCPDSSAFERAQYMRGLTSYHSV